MARTLGGMPDLKPGDGPGRPGAFGRAGFDYAGAPGCFDEMADETGGVRPHWQPFLRALDGMGLAEFIHGREESRQLIREHGITYNVYSDPCGRERPWELDAIPLIVPAEEAKRLEKALAQRVLLLERILADIYGPQRLLADRLLPAELVFDNPGFLRPCHGIRPAGGRFLFLYAANLARSPDGGFLCLGDRAQAPSGAGYALENRIVLSRMLPEVFRELKVERLALFFQGLRESLRAVAPNHPDNPRIVLLTPGPYNETYFEHAFLARYLGFTLAEGADLTVRDNRVYLKLIEGLQPVDVIFRRLDDDYCDPLELRSDSFLGVPGLVQAARQGNVAIANALGSGLVEALAFLPYLPGLCRKLLGEELLLPSPPSWWCGDPESLRHVLDRLDRLVIKPAFPASRLEPVFGDRLSAGARRELAARIRARPRQYAAQEIVPLSTAPVLAGDRLEARQVVLRVYLSAREDSCALLPGGLTRFSASPDTPVVSMQSGGGSKDTWMLAAGPVSSFTLLPPRPRAVEISRSGGDLPSRAADNLFWLGRYAERAEGLTRLLRGIVVRLTERSGLSETPELPALLRALPGRGGPRDAEDEGGGGGEIEIRLERFSEDLVGLIFNSAHPGSLAGAVASVARVAGMTRDRISIDMWRVITSLDFRELPRQAGRGARDSQRALRAGLDLLDRTVLTLSAFGGLAAESMTRGAGWRFLDMGRRLERCLHALALLEAALGNKNGSEGPVLEAVLEVADSSMTYRSRYLGELETAAMLDLLLTDHTNPRSVVFQMLALADDVRHLPRKEIRLEEHVVLESLAALRLADMEEMAASGGGGRRSSLIALLRKLSRGLLSFSDLIADLYLNHLQASQRHLAAPAGGGE